MKSIKIFDFNKVLVGFLNNFHEYFGFCLTDLSKIAKKFYHIIRLRGQLENYLETGKFNLELPSKYYKEAIDLKLNFNDETRNKEFINQVEKYLNEIYEIKEEIKNE